MRNIARAVIVAAAVAGANTAFAQDAWRAATPACIAQASASVPPSRLAALARGFNIPGWLDTPKPERPDLVLLAQLHARGFTHVRLPVAGEFLMKRFTDAATVSRQGAELDFAVATLNHLGFAVSIDMHPGRIFYSLYDKQPLLALDELRTLWQELARRYRDRNPERLFFEVLNEPPSNDGVWTSYGPIIAAAIRREAPDHTIIYGHANYQRIDALPDVLPLTDPNVAYAAHFYDPMIFTHQGLDWEESSLRYLARVPFPASLSQPAVTNLIADLNREARVDVAMELQKALRQPWTEKRVDAEIQQAAVWAQQHRRPVIINEFGVLGWKAEPTDRARWLRVVRSAAERDCIGWAHWDYAGGFGFVTRQGGREFADESILHALLDGPPRHHGGR